MSCRVDDGDAARCDLPGRPLQLRGRDVVH
jgi:hypothetical protein